jgi:hypothetical protein
VVVLTIALNELMQFCESTVRARFNAEATS